MQALRRANNFGRLEPQHGSGSQQLGAGAGSQAGASSQQGSASQQLAILAFKRVSRVGPQQALR